MVALASAFVRLRPQPNRREFRREGERMGDEAGKAAGESFGSQFTRGADGKLRDQRGKFVKDSEAAGREGGAKAGKAFGKAAGGGLGDTSTFARVLATSTARMTLFGAAAAAAAPGVIHLTAAIAPALGSLVAMPAALGAVSLASATTKIALAGVGDAIGAGFGDNAKKAEKALKELPPAAREFARSVIELKPKVDGLRRSVTGEFFKPLANDVRPLAEIYFPLLRREMSALAGPLGGLGEQLARSARSGQAFQAVSDLFLGTRLSVIRLRGAVDPLVQSFAGLIMATAPELPRIAGGISNAATRLAEFTNRAVESGAVVEVFQRSVDTLRDLGGIVFNVGSIVRSVFQAAATTSGGLLTNIRELTGQAAAFLNSAQGFAGLSSVFATLAQFGAALRTALAAVLPAIAASLQTLGPAIGDLAGPMADLIVAIAPLLPLVAGIAATILRELTPAIAGLATYLSENEDLVKGLAIAAASLFAVYKAGSIIMAVNAAGSLGAYLKSLPAVINLTKVWTAIQAALNFVMRANPIGLVVTALAALVGGLVLAYKNSETFRRIVDAAWAGIKTGVKNTVDWITGTAWPAIKRVWDGIAAGAMWLWRNAIEPAWRGIRSAIEVVAGFIKGAIAGITAAFRAVAAVATWLWRNIFEPVFKGIAKAAEIWWLAFRVIAQLFGNIIRNTVGAALTFMRNLFTTVFRWVMNNIISPWWKGTQVIFAAFRQYVVGPLLGALRTLQAFFATVFRVIANLVRAWWTGTVQPIFALVRAAWRIVADSFSSVYNNNIKPIFTRFIDLIRNNVVKNFQTAVNLIKVAWEKVKEYARKPVAFVVNSVINPFIGGLNKAAKIVGVKDQIEPIKGFARGGQIPGTRAPGDRDTKFARVRQTGKLFAVGAKEFITNARSTTANLPLVKAINAKRGRVTHADVDPFLDGGGGDGFGDFFGKMIDGFKGAANAVLHPKETLKKIANAALGRIPGAGFVVDFIKSGANRLITGAMDWLTKFGIGGGIGGAGIGGGWRGMRAAISGRFPGLNMISGPRPGAVTVTGNRSYHALGRAVDYPAVRALAAWIKATFGKKTKELITPWQDLNLHNGSPHHYTGRVWQTHNFAGRNPHVHWAAQLGGLVSRLTGMPLKLFDSGGAWPSGTLGANLSGRTEYVDANRGGGRGGVTINLYNPIIATERQAEELVIAGYNRAKRRGKLP